MSPSTVLVTGASRFIGGQLAACCGLPFRRHELSQRMGRAGSPRDLRKPLIAKVISGAKVDTVVHAAAHIDPRWWRRPSSACSGLQAGCGDRRWRECRTCV